MPTGYTADIENGMSFEDFVWRCARAFGALIMMREDPMDAPIPAEFKPDDYHAKESEKARARLYDYERMSVDEARDESDRKRGEHEKMIAEMNAKSRALKVKYDAMLARVREWQPPTKDHEGLRDFMIEQIESSIRFDCGDYQPDPMPVLSGKDWKARQIEKARTDIAYHETKQIEEEKRTHGRNEWVSALRASVPIRAACNCETKGEVHHGDCASNEPR